MDKGKIITNKTKIIAALEQSRTYSLGEHNLVLDGKKVLGYVGLGSGSRDSEVVITNPMNEQKRALEQFCVGRNLAHLAGVNTR